MKLDKKDDETIKLLERFKLSLIHPKPFSFTFPEHTNKNLTVPDKKFLLNIAKQKAILNYEKQNLKAVATNATADQWHMHTSSHHITKRLIVELKHKYNAELVTQAWCKFSEILHTFFGGRKEQIKTAFHLCEAPGAFVTSLNHFMRTNEHQAVDWIATSLNPYHELNCSEECIPEDTLIKSTKECWEFGRSNRGDLFSDGENIKQKVKSKLGQIDLITADGGVNCFDTPELQETMLTKLHIAEVDTALFDILFKLKN